MGLKDESAEPMCRISEYPRMFKHFDVGIVPLNPVQFNLAKSNLKGLEYSAAGIPFVASRFGEYIRTNEKYGFGLIPDGTHKTARKEARFWEQKLELLLDPNFRQEEREKNLAIVQQHYDMGKRWKDWEDVYKAKLRGEKVG